MNESLLKQNQDEIDAALTTIDENQTELQRAMSFTRTPKKDSTPETNVYRYGTNKSPISASPFGQVQIERRFDQDGLSRYGLFLTYSLQV